MRDPRLTERRNPRTAAIDTATSLEIVDLMSAEDAAVPAAVAARARADRPDHRPDRGRLPRRGAALLRRRRHQRPARRARRLGMPAHLRHGAGDGAGDHRRRAPGAGQVHRGSGGRRRRRHRRRGRAPASAPRTWWSASPPAAPRRSCAPRWAAPRRSAPARCSSPAPSRRRCMRRHLRRVHHGAGRPRGGHRLDPAEGRHRHQAGAQHPHHRRHGPARQDLRQPHGGPPGPERRSWPTAASGS